jgi:phosphate transport system substrate-binding protein
MPKKSETTILLVTFLITAGVLAGGFWWLSQSQSSENSSSSQVKSNDSSQSQAIQEKTFEQVKNVPKGLASYGGSTSWAPIRQKIDPVIQKSFPEFELRYTDPQSEAPNTTTGISMLLKAQLEFAQASRPITNGEFEEAQKRGIKLKAIPVAIDGLAVVVHPNLNIPGITTDQFEAIFDGKITNWREVGGPNLKIQPYGKKGRDNGAYFKLTGTTTEAIRKVASDLGGIYWAGAPLLVSQCGVKPLPIGRNSNQFIPPYQEPFVPPSRCPQLRNKVDTNAIRTGEYPLSRRLIVVVKDNGGFEQQAGEAYANLLLTNEGQRMIELTGFVSIR